MKSIFFTVACFAAVVGHAQPIIQPSHVVTYLTTEALTGTTNGFDPGLPGADKIWDFSHLTLLPAGTIDIVRPVETPFSDRFPTSTFAIAYTGQTNESYAFYTQTNDKIECIGQSFSGIGTVEHSDAKTLITFPYTYNTVVRDDFRISGQTTSFVSVYDAYGTLVMPYGTHRNVIRQKIEQNGQTDYTWFNANPFYPILQTAAADGTLGVMMHTETLFKDFEPNRSYTLRSDASGNIFTVAAHQNTGAEISVYDVVGKLVARTKLDKRSATLHLQHCEAGIYMVGIRAGQSNALHKIVKCSTANRQSLATDRGLSGNLGLSD